MPLTGRIGGDRRTRLRWVRTAVAVCFVLALVGLPAYLSALPGFFGRYPALAEQHSEWRTSSHMAVSCDQCHVEPRPVPRAAYRARMVGEFYVSLVARDRVPGLFPRPKNAACLDCHSELRTSSPKGDLQIPHRAHITILEMECVQCHNYLVHELSPEGGHTPPMAGCLKCHDGDTAKDACRACHTEKAAPPDHATEDWLIVHAGHSQDPECATCHKWKRDWCADCHRDRPRSHGPDWRQVHGERVAQHRSCEACHSGTFCVRCHGEVPALNHDPALELVE
ncbi:MAG: hypothetical protein ACYC6J_07335 [Coriobacteriia bacterium]